MPFLAHVGSLGIVSVLLVTGALVYAQPIDDLREGAKQGDATAQFSLGKRYESGQGVSQDYVRAHMWFSLAASRVSGEVRRVRAVQSRELVEQEMTRAQIAAAGRLAAAWLLERPTPSTDSDRPSARDPESTTQQSFYEYRLLATTRTSSMEREMNEAAENGYRFQEVMGGDTAVGGSEVVSLMMKGPASDGDGADVAGGRFSYRLLATNQTSTMQAEMQELGQGGYDYRGVTVFESFFGGDEVVVIMELDNEALPVNYDYVLLATSRTSTLQSELTEVGQRGFELVGMVVGDTVFGGDEVIAITRRTLPR